MISTTHYAFSFLLTSAAGAGTETALSASLLSLLPDIDHPHSIAGRMFPGLSKWILRKYGHRTVTHSLFAIATVAVILSPVIPLSASMKGGSGVSLYLYLVMAYASHILIDIFNYSGVRLLAPFSHKEYISFRTPSFRLPVSSSKEHVLLLVILTLAILTAGRTFSASGAVRSIGKIFYKNYTTAIEDYRNSSMFVCKARLRYFDHVSRSIVSGEYSVLNLFQNEIILMDNARDDPRLVIPRDDIQEIEVLATQTPLRTNSISGFDPELLHEVPPGAFVSGSIIVHNFNPDIVPNRFVKVSQGVNTLILSYSSALPSELSRIAALDWTVQYELERMKKSLPENRKAVLEARGRALRKRINALNSLGFYEHYGDIVRLEDEAKSIQSRIDALNLKLDIGYEKTRQTIENIERGYSVDIDLVWLKI